MKESELSQRLRQHYAAEFKLELVEKVLAGARPAQVARSAKVPVQTLHNWLRAAKGERVDRNLNLARAISEIDELFIKAKAAAVGANERKVLHALQKRVKSILSVPSKA